MTFDLIKRLLKEEDGAAAVEYAILVAVIGGVVLAAIQNNFNLGGIFASVTSAVQAIIGEATGTGG